MINGHATPDGTSAYASEHHPLQYHRLGDTGLTVSPCGFGCYRVNHGISSHEQAMEKALLEGVNLLDTSSNYGDGGSEELVGSALAKLISSGRISRQSIIVVSKVGYLQGQNYDLSQERKQVGTPFKDLVLYGEGLEHCIHPDFLDDQLSRSLKRLNVETVDVYLLHNPEYYLGWAHKHGMPLEDARNEYYGRIEKAFEYLEEAVQQNRIRFYGISSNTFPSPAPKPDFTCLHRVWEIAGAVNEQHHFRMIQCPMNLMESGAVLKRNQPDGDTLLAFAAKHQIGVLINRPLNAIFDNQLIRLAEPEQTDPVSFEDTVSRIEAVKESEQALIQRILPRTPLPASIQSRIAEQISLADPLAQHWESFGSFDRCRDAMDQYFLPRFQGVMAYFEERLSTHESLAGWMASHGGLFQKALGAVRFEYMETARKRAEKIKAAIAGVDPEWSGNGTLSQLAIRTIRSSRGVSSVLVGMRKESYVADIIEELQRPVNQADRTKSWQGLDGIEI